MSSLLSGALGALGGGTIGQATVKLLLDTQQYQGQLTAAKTETAAATNAAATSTSKFSGVATAAYAAAGIAAITFAKDAIAAASEHEQVIAALVAQVGNNTQAYEEQATALQALSGFQDEAILGADTILSRFKLTQQQVQAAIPTVLDYARATGKTVPDAASAVGKALLGNTRALKAVGIAYTSTGNAAQDYNNILDLLNQKVGGQAAAFADTYAGKLEILATKYDELKESVGSGLIEEISKFSDSLINASEAVDSSTGHTGVLGDALHKLLVDFNPLVIAFHYSESALNSLASALGVNTGATDQQAVSTDQLTTSTGTSVTHTLDFVEAQAKLARQTKQATRAIQEQRLAQLQAAGGVLGLVSALQQSQEAQATINQLQRQGKTNSDAYRQAVIAATQSQLDFRTQVRQFAADNPNRSLVALRNTLKELAAQAHISGSDFRQALGGPLKEVLGMVDAINAKRIAPQVDTSGVDRLKNDVRSLQSALNRAGA